MSHNTWILSAGIDVGTTSTHWTLSKLYLDNQSAANQTPRMAISKREILYQSAVYFTPLSADGTINGEAVAALLKKEYSVAGVEPHQVQTGAAIVTGESARKTNADKVIHSLAALCGEFVVASAGPHLESILAARGSGAARASEERRITICNVDIGGGTTNAAVYSNGRLLDTSCLGIGARCLQFSSDCKLVSMTDSGDDFLDAVAKSIPLGAIVSNEQLELFGNLLGEVILHFIASERPPQVTRRLISTEPLSQKYKIDEFWFSGGVAEFMRKMPEDMLLYSDMGAYIASGLLGSLQERQLSYFVPDNPIRATVIGAGMHSLQLTGSTVHVSDHLLPLKNIPLIRPFTDLNMSSDFKDAVTQRLFATLSHHDLSWSEKPVAIMIDDLDDISFSALKRWAEALAKSFDTLQGSQPLVLVTAQDIALALGQLLRSALPDTQIAVIDGVRGARGDFVDIGKPLPHHNALPVVIKDLIFAD